MVSFRAKEISNPLRIGERLTKAREKLALSLESAGREINISARYLQALEAGEYNKLPGEIYAKSFLKVYAAYLGLDPREFINDYGSEQRIYSKTKKLEFAEQKNPVKRISRLHLAATPKIIRGMFIAILALICLAYLGVKIKAIMAPPLLAVEQPAADVITTQNFIDVAGRIGPETTLQVNGQQVIADQQGRFKETLELQLGTNLIEFKATTRHGKQTKIFRQVMVNQENN
jgi:cytoskeletal protein RodZ